MPEQICFPEEEKGNISGVWSPQNSGSGNGVASALATLQAHHPMALGKVGGIRHPSHVVTAAVGKQLRLLPKPGPNIVGL